MPATPPFKRPPARRGRPPALTDRGRAWALGATLLLGGGALLQAWPIAGLGVVSFAALSVGYLAFFPSAIFLWRDHLEAGWRLERGDGQAAPMVGRPLRLQVKLRVRAPRDLGQVSLRAIASTGLELQRPLAAWLVAGTEVALVGEILPRRAGRLFLHGMALAINDRWGLFVIEAYFPSPLSLRVLPRTTGGAGARARRVIGDGGREHACVRGAVRPGHSGDLRELREHLPGDAFKMIAWKATARRGRLMVRQVEEQTVRSHVLAVDIDGSLRDGPPGSSRLDASVELAAAYLTAALTEGDRVGLMTFAGRIHAELPAREGPAHRLRLIDPLLDALAPVDEDLTGATDADLVGAVSRYLLIQHGIETHIARIPPLDDPRWSHLAAGPRGELVDLRALELGIAPILAQDRPAGSRRPQASGAGPDPRAHPAHEELAAMQGDGGHHRLMERLRRCCLLRGIELPTRSDGVPGRRARGLCAVLERAARERGARRIVVFSDFAELDPGLAELARALKLVRARGHELVLISARPLPPPAPGGAQPGAPRAVREILSWAAARRRVMARQRLASLGVAVREVGLGDPGGLLRAQGGIRPAPSAGFGASWA